MQVTNFNAEHISFSQPSTGGLSGQNSQSAPVAMNERLVPAIHNSCP